MSILRAGAGSWYSRAVGRSFGLLAVAFLAVGCAQEVIAHQQTERDANKMVKILQDQGIAASKLKDEESRDLRFNIHVPADQQHNALAILEDHNLPEVQKKDSAAVSGEGGLIPTSEQELTKKIVGIEGDLTNALRALPRVVDVKVTVTVPREDPLRDPNKAKPRPKASVILVYQPDATDIPPISTEDVQRFVQAKFEGIRAEEVSVLLIPNKLAAPAGAGAGAGASAARVIDPLKGCEVKELILGIEVCAGNKKKIINIVVVAVIVAGVFAGLAVVGVLRALHYRKEYTKLTAQFPGVKKT